MERRKKKREVRRREKKEEPAQPQASGRLQGRGRLGKEPAGRPCTGQQRKGKASCAVLRVTTKCGRRLGDWCREGDSHESVVTQSRGVCPGGRRVQQGSGPGAAHEKNKTAAPILRSPFWTTQEKPCRTFVDPE